MSASQPLSRSVATRRLSRPPFRSRGLTLSALIGATLVLLAYPASRPFYVGMLLPSGLDRALANTSSVARGTRQLPNSNTLDGRAIWFSVAAQRILNHRRIGENELKTVEQLMVAGADAEPQNAFWEQADAALLLQLGKSDQAIAAWLRASRRLNWSDHQNDFLGADLAVRPHPPAYAYAELYELRTPYDDPRQSVELGVPAAVRLIYETANKLTWLQPEPNVEMRLASVLNGTLVRQRARSVAATRLGTKIIEAGVSKQADEPEDPRHPGVKGLLIARDKFTSAVVHANLGYDERAVGKLFNEAEGAYAITTLEDVRGTMQLEAEGAAVLHTAPGAFLMCTFLGLLLMGGRWLIGRFSGIHVKNPWPLTVGAAAMAVGTALFFTSAFAAFALGLCIVFAGSTPTHVRKRRPEWLGPLFWVVTSSVTTVLLLACAAGFVLGAAPTRVLLVPKLPAAFDGQAMVCGVIALAIGFLFLCAPLWAFAQRLPTVHVLNIGLGQVSQKLV